MDGPAILGGDSTEIEHIDFDARASENGLRQSNEPKGLRHFTGASLIAA
jgi:hypothetical protein